MESDSKQQLNITLNPHITTKHFYTLEQEINTVP